MIISYFLDILAGVLLLYGNGPQAGPAAHFIQQKKL